MNVAAKRQLSPSAQARAEMYRRFGWAVVVSSVLITSGAFAVYMRAPHAPLQPQRIHTPITTVGNTAPPAEIREAAPRVRNVLDVFVHALAVNDETELRSVYPAMSRYDERLVHELRTRVGGDTALHVERMQLADATADEVHVNFLLVGSKAQNRAALAATIRNTDTGWKIVEVH
jgi:hypothetical protein